MAVWESPKSNAPPAPDVTLPMPRFDVAPALPKRLMTSGFSLVEVTLAIGIIAFALMAVVGLLPVGLRTVKNSNEQAAAAIVLRTIADAVHTATVNGTTTIAHLPYGKGDTNLSATTYTWEELTLEGTANPSFKQLAAVLTINTLPDPTTFTPGAGTISVAWSAQANPVWNPSTGNWTKAEGFLTAPIIFMPRQTP